jgi:hypothetical protein
MQRTGKKTLRRAMWLLAATLSLAAAGCGYTTASLHDEQYSTVAVPIFKNDTFYRENEFALTEAVKKEIETKTRYKVTNENEADTVLTGTIVGIQQPVLTEDQLDRIAEQQFVVTVHVQWKDSRTGKIIKQAYPTMRREADVRRGETLNTAADEAYADLAEEIVELLEKEW